MSSETIKSKRVNNRTEMKSMCIKHVRKKIRNKAGKAHIKELNSVYKLILLILFGPWRNDLPKWPFCDKMAIWDFLLSLGGLWDKLSSQSVEIQTVCSIFYYDYSWLPSLCDYWTCMYFYLLLCHFCDVTKKPVTCFLQGLSIVRCPLNRRHP